MHMHRLMLIPRTSYHCVTVTCVSSSDDSVQLKSIVSVKHDNGSTNLVNAAVTFYSVEKDGDLKIGEIKTDVHGSAILKIPSRIILTQRSADAVI